MNKDLVLREFLAIERTKLANERTLLTYIRTGLYFIVAGITLSHFLDTPFWITMEIPAIVFGLLIIIFGAIRFLSVKKAIINSMQHIGSAANDFINSIKGTV
jgi:putative membrane protein